MNLFQSYKDPSLFLHPGVEMHYQIPSVYVTLESTPTDLGSVVPLDSFNVALESPAPEAVNVSQTPNFRWRATNALESSEGPVVYNYRMFIYDWIQSDNGLITPVGPNGNFFDFQTDSAGPIIVGFTGDEVNPDWNCIWNWYNPYSNAFLDYTADKLEPNKTYNWGINIAYALVKDADSRAYSIAADFKYRDTGWYYDPLMMEPDLHADFTTGAQ